MITAKDRATHARVQKVLDAKRDEELREAIERRTAKNTPWTDPAGIEQAKRFAHLPEFTQPWGPYSVYRRTTPL